MLYTLKLYNVICQLYLNIPQLFLETGKKISMVGGGRSGDDGFIKIYNLSTPREHFV